VKTEPISIVAIHGVGNRKSGELLTAAAKGLSANGEVSLATRLEFFRGDQYQRAVISDHPSVANVFEVTWDDLSPPARDPIRLIIHAFSVVSSMLRLADDGVAFAGCRLSLGKIYRWMFMALLVWCIYPPIAMIGAFDTSTSRHIFWAAAVFLVTLLIAWLLKPYDRNFRFGYAWAGAALVFALFPLIDKASASPLLKISTWAYTSFQGLTGLVLFLTIGEVWFRSKNIRSEQKLCRMGLLYLPFALISGVGAIVWVGWLWFAQQVFAAETVSAWSRAYLKQISYDLAFMESVLGVGVAVCAILLLWPAHAIIQDKQSGAQVHNRLVWVLRMLPWVLIAVAVLYWVHLPLLLEHGECVAFKTWIEQPLARLMGRYPSSECPRIMSIYAASALRLVPFLPWLFGPFRTLLDVVGDVMLYLDGDGHLSRENIRIATRNRFRKALLLATQEAQGKPVVIIAHSQGTVIAADVLSEGDWANVWFVSLGSPIGSLYWRFMGENTVARPKYPWLNLYRDGDYIAGGKGFGDHREVSAVFHEESLGPGRHGDYFEDPEVWSRVIKWLDSHPEINS